MTSNIVRILETALIVCTQTNMFCCVQSFPLTWRPIPAGWHIILVRYLPTMVAWNLESVIHYILINLEGLVVGTSPSCSAYHILLHGDQKKRQKACQMEGIRYFTAKLLSYAMKSSYLRLQFQAKKRVVQNHKNKMKKMI